MKVLSFLLILLSGGLLGINLVGFAYSDVLPDNVQFRAWEVILAFFVAVTSGVGLASD